MIIVDLFFVSVLEVWWTYAFFSQLYIPRKPALFFVLKNPAIEETLRIAVLRPGLKPQVGTRVESICFVKITLLFFLDVKYFDFCLVYSYYSIMEVGIQVF